MSQNDFCNLPCLNTFINQCNKFTRAFIEVAVRKIRGSCPEVFLRKGVLKICSKFTEEHPCQRAISIKL